jgi:hypothetical protein
MTNEIALIGWFAVHTTKSRIIDERQSSCA